MLKLLLWQLVRVMLGTCFGLCPIALDTVIETTIRVSYLEIDVSQGGGKSVGKIPVSEGKKILQILTKLWYASRLSLSSLLFLSFVSFVNDMPMAVSCELLLYVDETCFYLWVKTQRN